MLALSELNTLPKRERAAAYASAYKEAERKLGPPGNPDREYAEMVKEEYDSMLTREAEELLRKRAVPGPSPWVAWLQVSGAIAGPYVLTLVIIWSLFSE